MKKILIIMVTIFCMAIHLSSVTATTTNEAIIDIVWSIPAF